MLAKYAADAENAEYAAVYCCKLRFRGGRVAEFKLAAGSSGSLAAPHAAVGSSSAGCSGGAAGGARLDEEALSQLRGDPAGERLGVISEAAAGAASAAAAAADGLPAKPGSTSLSPDEIITACRQAKAAAQANARMMMQHHSSACRRAKADPRVVTGLDGFARKQVLEAAAARQQEAEAARLASEAQRAAQHAQLKAALDQRAQGIKQQQEDSKRQLSAVLAQQVRDKQGSSRQQAQGPGGALLIHAPDPAAVASQRMQRQAEAALDQQLAAKASMQQQLKARDTERALAELERVQQSLVASVQASRSSRQQALKQVLYTE
ncbi:hypothetical protein COO60DRAFT_1704165 [Scenedesmus sp. NREL 46B-D3]|nr:hypothetical protein COO60DRAFT_1704165 [Scenedesmus sp. NREL 46B-D3]